MTVQAQEGDFFALAQQVVGETNSANLRQMQAASHAVVASYAAETHQKAVALAARTLRSAGQAMLQTCNELRTEMEADPLSEVMYQAAYMQSARALVELIALASGQPIESAAKNAAKILKCEARDLLTTGLPQETARQIEFLRSSTLLEHNTPANEIPNTSTSDSIKVPPPKANGKRKALGNNGLLQYSN